MQGHIVVVDVGKTMSKVTLWTPTGTLIARRTRLNQRVATASYIALDTHGIEDWLADVLSEYARLATITAIVPVAHGAALAVVRGGRLCAPPIDYEHPVPAGERLRYEEGRDSFARTGSPALPDGLNAGVQLHMLETFDPRALAEGATILTWPQYWCWLLSGIQASEVSSLGCHTDLWCPVGGKPSSLALDRGWAKLFAPLRRAGDAVGPILPDWAKRTGLPSDTQVFCGLHDSNAALLAARGFSEIADHEATVLSTGTWFIAMRALGPGIDMDLIGLDESRDCLVNVDVHGRPVPSARFMGGREIETLTDADARRLDSATDQPQLLDTVPATLRSGAMVVPTFAPGCGPFPHTRGCWIGTPDSEAERRAAVGLYAALVADVSLDLIGSRERLVIEGRFAAACVFTRALAALRPDTAVYVADAGSDVSYGALRLVKPDLAPRTNPVRIEPLNSDLSSYCEAWRAATERLRLSA